jgi:hypothetical protein
VINEYDINDYRTKAELTHTRLITTVSAALRSYEQLHALAEHRRGLELIVGACRFGPDGAACHYASFAEGILTQLAALLKLSLDGIICTQRGSPFGDDSEQFYVVGAAGRHALATSLSRWRYAAGFANRVCDSDQHRRSANMFSGRITPCCTSRTSPHQDAAIFLDSGQALTASEPSVARSVHR